MSDRLAGEMARLAAELAEQPTVEATLNSICSHLVVELGADALGPTVEPLGHLRETADLPDDPEEDDEGDEDPEFGFQKHVRRPSSAASGLNAGGETVS